jgi:hypothetical protein
MSKIINSLISLLMLGSLSAQSFLTKVNPFPDSRSTQDTVKILAVMVNFQDDKDAATFGNGKFGTIYSKDYGTKILDPLPHYKEYFESHLQFVQNYFDKVSKGKQVVTYTVLPDTFSVSKTMRNYSPSSNSTDFSPMAEFASEVWTKADQLYPGFNFNNYNLFAIFHAGVGRDISLPGSLGNERDIPSLYLSPKALQNIYGSSFQGFPVSGGNFKINNSMILPETESRELSSLGNTFLFEITINGLIAASVASHLGLPDLFDTKSGLSAIGRFGLMDGQSIFAYNGVFPPEPSAWEKIYLGWEQPVMIDPLPGLFNLIITANAVSTGTDAAIFKIPINSSEYFLVENRIRDTQSDGAKITYKINGQILTKTFPNDTTGFQSFAVDSIDGVVIDVDEYDWAVPGNGIVIWHIDENIINAKIAENKINADKNNRGVDVEEADGIQDIGEQFTTIFGDVVIGEGSTEDFWYSGNPSKLYKNKFSKDTRPNSRSNSSANSLITVWDFSPISNRMNFKVSFGDSIIKPIFSKNINIPQDKDVKLTYFQESNTFYMLSGNDLILFDENGDSIKSLSQFSNFKPIVVNNQNNNYVIGALGSKINLYRTFSNTEFPIVTTDIFNTEEVSSAPIFSGGSIILSTKSDKLLQYSIGDTAKYIKTLNSQASGPIIKSAFDTVGSYYSYVTDSKFFENGDEVFSANNIKDLVLTKNSLGEFVSAVLIGNNRIYFHSSTKGKLADITFSSQDTIHSLSLGDLKNDGENYIVFTNGKHIEAVNLLGASADNFPFVDPQDIGFTGTPLITDFTGDSKAEVIAFTKDGRIFAIDGGTGKLVDGFPISTGAEISCTPVLFSNAGKLSIAAINKKNTFAAWQIGANEGKQFWSEENGNNFNSAFVDAASRINLVNEFFPVSKAYNYPNPVYDGSTFIRYFVAEDSKINIKIFDLAGDFVAELNDNARGGFDNEIKWDVGNIQSGVYLARIEANSSSGKTESKVIKIAVVK